MLAMMQKQFMLAPNGTFRSRWDGTQAFLLIYIAIILPWRLGFNQPAQLWSFWFSFDLLVDIYFWIDLVLNFRTAVYTYEGELEHRPLVVAKMYARAWFPIDLVSCLPFGYIEYIFPVEDNEMGNNKALRLLRLMRLLKLLRLARFKRIFDRWEEQMYSTGGLKMVKLLGIIFLSAHFAACGWYAVGTTENHDVLNLMGKPQVGWAVTNYDMLGGPRNATTLTHR